MKLITRETNAAEAAQRYKTQILDVRAIRRGPFTDLQKRKQQEAETAYESLLSLGDSPRPDDVDAIIGNDSWTETKCHECGALNVPVVELGEPDDYDSATARICLECLTRAANLITGEAHK